MVFDAYAMARPLHRASKLPSVSTVLILMEVACVCISARYAERMPTAIHRGTLGCRRHPRYRRCDGCATTTKDPVVHRILGSGGMLDWWAGRCPAPRRASVYACRDRASYLEWDMLLGWVREGWDNYSILGHTTTIPICQGIYMYSSSMSLHPPTQAVAVACTLKVGILM